jgi:hypothetical protein
MDKMKIINQLKECFNDYENIIVNYKKTLSSVNDKVLEHETLRNEMDIQNKKINDLEEQIKFLKLDNM